MISLIVAMASNRVIGQNNHLPWHLPADLKHFRQHTMGKPIIMGRKTFESIGKPLPGRKNIVITQNIHWQSEGVQVAHSLTEAFTLAEPAPEIMVIGGASLYQQALTYAERIYLTLIEATFEGDTFFPEWDQSRWHEIQRETHQHDESGIKCYHFVTFEKHRTSI